MPQIFSFQHVISVKIIHKIFCISWVLNLQSLVCVYFVLWHVFIRTSHISRAPQSHVVSGYCFAGLAAHL